MNHNMVLSYDYAKRKSWRRRMNAPPSLTISMTMQRRWSDTCGIAWCSMSRATLEATGRRHRATTRSISPWRPPGKKSTQQWCNMYPLCWLFRWPSRCGAFIKATKHCHWARNRTDIAQSDTPTPVVSSISSWKRARVDMLVPNNNRGMTYQTEENNLTYLVEYFVGVVKLAL